MSVMLGSSGLALLGAMVLLLVREFRTWSAMLLLLVVPGREEEENV